MYPIHQPSHTEGRRKSYLHEPISPLLRKLDPPRRVRSLKKMLKKMPTMLTMTMMMKVMTTTILPNISYQRLEV
jgi:hypothetical protein